MRILLIFIILSLGGCSTLKYEFKLMRQRAEVKKSDYYMIWDRAKIFIVEHCAEITSLYQGHSKVVSVSFGKEQHIESVSDTLDEILSITDNCLPEETVIIME